MVSHWRRFAFGYRKIGRSPWWALRTERLCASTPSGSGRSDGRPTVPRAVCTPPVRHRRPGRPRTPAWPGSASWPARDGWHHSRGRRGCRPGRADRRGVRRGLADRVLPAHPPLRAAARAHRLRRRRGPPGRRVPGPLPRRRRGGRRGRAGPRPAPRSSSSRPGSPAAWTRPRWTPTGAGAVCAARCSGPGCPAGSPTAWAATAWLTALATDILVWVGVTSTAGTEVWPLEAWAQQRGSRTGDWAASEPCRVAREVERGPGRHAPPPRPGTRPMWSGPLGAKQAPVAAAPVADAADGEPAAPLALGDPRRADRVGAAAPGRATPSGHRHRGSARGEQAEAIVVEVIRTVFGGASPARSTGPRTTWPIPSAG